MSDKQGISTVNKVPIDRDELLQLNKLIDNPESAGGRPVLSSIVDKVTHGRDNTCSVCGLHDSLTSFHRTKMKRWKDGRICIEDFPIFTCHSIDCMRLTNEIEHTLSKQYGKAVIDSTVRSELRMCVGCKQLLNSERFDGHTWNHFDRRCRLCDEKLFMHRSDTHVKRAGAAFLPLLTW